MKNNANTRNLKELEKISAEIAKIQKRLAVLKTRFKGEDMEPIVAEFADAINAVSRDVAALIAKAKGSLTPDQVRAALTPSLDAIKGLAATIEAELA